MKLLQVAAVLATASLASGCARYQWQKAGATEAEFNRDMHSCQMEAARTFPTQIVQTQIGGGYMTPSTTNCYGTGSAYGSGGMVYGNTNTNCITTPGQYVAPIFTSSDANERNRTNAAYSCMNARGYQRVQVK